jgi:hypothetical protein
MMRADFSPDPEFKIADSNDSTTFIGLDHVKKTE